LSQTGATGLSGNTLSQAMTYFDAVPYYNADGDRFELVFVNGVNKAFTYAVANDLTFSTLTNAPFARYVATFDNRLIFANANDSTFNLFPQRVAWSERGAPSIYTAPTGGFEELLDAKGEITRLMAESDRLIIFFDSEIWQGLRIAFPFTFQFIRLEPKVGTQASWSVAHTPHGMVFLGNDLNLYLLPAGGTPRAIGDAVWRHIRETIAPRSVAAANGVWDAVRGGYLLTYQTRQSTEQGVFVQFETDRVTWNPVGFDMSSGWSIRRMGTTSMATASNFLRNATERVLVADSGLTGMGNSNVLEWTSLATSDLGNPITCRYLTPLGNPNPTERQIVQEVRLDYRSVSASSMSLRISPDFGTTYPVDRGVALPPASASAQTVLGVNMSAVYPTVEFVHDSGGTFVLQGASVLLTGGGHG